MTDRSGTMEKHTLLFATNNRHKIEEIQSAVGDNILIRGLEDAGIFIDIPEPHDTLHENAAEKSSTVYALTGISCFSEDTGLEVAALNGEPGVRSARYAGTRSDDDNIKKLLTNLEGKDDRSAQFRTVISLIWNGKQHFFEGICKGRIISARKGAYGFGYDPVFIPDGSEKTFAEMNVDEKNRFSHRNKAAMQLVLFLQQQV